MTKIIGMSGLEIHFALKRRGFKLIDIARRAGVKPAAVTRMLKDDDPYIGRRLRPYIAKALGMQEEEIWPPEQKQKLAQ